MYFELMRNLLTKYNREKLGFDKSHSNDAFIISHNFDAKRLDVEYLYRKVRRHNRQLYKTKPSKGGKRRRNQSNYIINGFKKETNKKVNEKMPVWFNEQIEKENLSTEEEKELDEMLKKYHD